MQVYSPSKLLDYALIYALMFPSGVMIFNTLPAQQVVLLAITAGAGFAFLRYVGRINGAFLLYLIAFVSFTFVIYLYTDGGLPLTSIAGSVVKLFLAYFVIKLLGDRFLLSYLHVIVFLSAISIFGFACDIVGISKLLAPVLPKLTPMAAEGLLYGFNDSGHPTRNNSIFYEPGAFQAFVNAGIFILLFAKLEMTETKRKQYFTVLVVTLLTTMSTTGFLIFMVFLGAAFVRKSALSARAKTGVVVALALAPIVFVSQFDYVLKKFESYTAVRGVTDKQDLRSFELLVDLTLIKENFFGWGEKGYLRGFQRIGKTQDATHTSSNGITKLAAIYGVPFAIFYFGTVLWFFVRRLDDWFVGIAGFVGFMIFLYAESYYLFTPICSTFIAAIFVVRRNVPPQHVSGRAESSSLVDVRDGR